MFIRFNEGFDDLDYEIDDKRDLTNRRRELFMHKSGSDLAKGAGGRGW